jgi:hypothetical protein
MRQARRDKHSKSADHRGRKSSTCRKAFDGTLHQIDSALGSRDAGRSRSNSGRISPKGGHHAIRNRSPSGRRVPGHSLTMLERIAAVCGVALKLHAEEKPNFDREVALV